MKNYFVPSGIFYYFQKKHSPTLLPAMQLIYTIEKSIPSINGLSNKNEILDLLNLFIRKHSKAV